MLEEIAQGMTSPPLLITDMTIGQMAAVLQRAKLVLGVDSGPVHLAVAQRTPTIHIFGPTDPRMHSTLDRIQRELASDSHVYRYDPKKAADDGLRTDEGTFSPCSFWLAETLALVEVGIDFTEEDVTFLSDDQVKARIGEIDAALLELLSNSRRFESINASVTRGIR